MSDPRLSNLQDEFLEEAKNAPKLFRDLAKVEQYIAESYKTRALIELIQNADDAGASLFGLHEFNSGFVVGNNGRPFTAQDVEALCRSGSSNKARGGSTIGYRGIGFKSVVNLAKEIYVLSGDFAFFFNKNSTQKKIQQDDIDVPLIRVPHMFAREDNELIWDELIEFKNAYSYQTLFFFDALDKRISVEDISGFDRNSLLFLNNLRLIKLHYEGVSRTISMECSNDSGHDLIGKLLLKMNLIVK
jgi:hypothetical protein